MSEKSHIERILEHKPGAVEILCKEIGFRFEPGMETDANLIAFVRVLVNEVEEMRGWRGAIASRIGSEAPSVESGNVLSRVKTMLDAPTREAIILSASCAHDYIHEVAPEDAYPCDHLIDMLSSCVSAVRFGLEMPCNSRHAASACQHIWRIKYGVSLHDSHTPTWEKDWARTLFQRALLLQVARVEPMRKALRDLTMLARTSGGTAGRDDELCAACDRAEALLSIYN